MQLWRSKRRRDDLAEEIRQHLEAKTEELLREGKPRAEAEREAKIAFGNPTLVQEQSDEVWRLPFSGVLGDFCYALRLFRNNPGFVAAITLTLTLGIGANFAVFNLLYSLLLANLPVQEPGRLVHLAVRSPGASASGHSDAPGPLNLPIMNLIEQRARSIDGVLGWTSQDFNLDEGGVERKVPGALVSGNAFAVLGLKPSAGRLLNARDDEPGGGGNGWAVVVSFGFWQAHYGGSQAAIGRTIRISDQSATIVGVAPRGFDSVLIDNHPSLYLPLEFKGAIEGPHSILHQAGAMWLTCLARLKPGVSQAQAGAEMNALWPGILDATVPPKVRHIPFVEGLRIRVLPGRTGWSYLRVIYARPLTVVQGLVGIVFLLCCTNIGGLCLARTMARQHEFETRCALGASRGRLVRQMLIESFTLALPGALIAVWFAWQTDRVLTPLVSEQIAPHLTGWIWAGILPAACLSAALFGALPAALVGKLTKRSGTVQNARIVGSRVERRVGWIYLPIQIAMSLTLVFTASLFTATLSHLRNDDLGFKTAGVYLVGLDLAKMRLPPGDALRLQRRFIDRLSQGPGVIAASLAANTPLNGATATNAFAVLDGDKVVTRPLTIASNEVGPGYFEVFGTSVLRGRLFRNQDADVHSCILNQSASRKLFGSVSPLNHVLRVSQIRMNGDTSHQDCLVVGEVQDAKYATLREAPPATVYRAWGSAEGNPASSTVVIRATSIVAARSALSKTMDELAPQAPRDELIEFAEQVNTSLRRERMLVILANFFAILALALSAVGVFGVTSWTVTRRTQEIGVRSALGATQSEITRPFVAQALRIALTGLTAGAVAALLVTGWFKSLLFGVHPADTGLLLTSIGLLGAIVLLAAYLPARRAASRDPMQALRHD